MTECASHQSSLLHIMPRKLPNKDVPLQDALLPIPSALLSDSLLLGSITKAVLAPSGSMQSVFVHPFVIGGWCGLVATALNCLPVGALDGGRIMQVRLQLLESFRLRLLACQAASRLLHGCRCTWHPLQPCSFCFSTQPRQLPSCCAYMAVARPNRVP